MDKAVVLFSGGIDSTVLLWWAKEKWDCICLSFNFPGRRQQEIIAEKKLLQVAQVQTSYHIDLPFIHSPKASQACYIPNRNLMYYSTAASLAEQVGSQMIFGGHICHDGDVFPDAHSLFFEQFENLIQHSGRLSIQLKFPFIQKQKKDVIALGHNLNVPFQWVWSCSHDVQEHCWRCNSCIERKSGFN